MKYFNVGTKGLNGRPHPVLSAAVTTSEVKAMRPVVKMLLCDYYTYSVKDSQSGGGAHCRLCPTPTDKCPPPTEDIEHVLTQCVGTEVIRLEKLEELMAVTTTAKSGVNCNILRTNSSILTQFILDCTSNNLDNNVRVSMNDPVMTEILEESADESGRLAYQINNNKSHLLSDDLLNVESVQFRTFYL